MLIRTPPPPGCRGCRSERRRRGPPRATEVAISLDAFLTRAVRRRAKVRLESHASLRWRRGRRRGPARGLDAAPRRCRGRLCVGNQLEILRADAARTSRSSASAVAGTSWRAGEVVSYDKDTGEHEVAFFDGEEVRCHLFLQTMRWLPMRYEPVGGVPEGPGPEGGIAYAMPPIPVARRRARVPPSGEARRGTRAIRRRDQPPRRVMAEYTVPDGVERLGGRARRRSGANRCGSSRRARTGRARR